MTDSSSEEKEPVGTQRSIKTSASRIKTSARGIKTSVQVSSFNAIP